MCEEGSDGGIDAGDHSLRFPEWVHEQDAGFAGLLISSPPRVDFAECFALAWPPENRQSKRRLGDERVTADWLERRTGGVGRELVIARNHPDLAILFDANLRRSEDMTGGMKRHMNAIYLYRAAVVDRFNGRTRIEASAQKPFAGPRGQVFLRAGTQVVGMRVGDDGAAYRIPRVDIKIASWAVETVTIGFEKIAHRCLKLV